MKLHHRSFTMLILTAATNPGTAAWSTNEDVAAGSLVTDATAGVSSQAIPVVTGAVTGAFASGNVTVTTGSSTLGVTGNVALTTGAQRGASSQVSGNISGTTGATTATGANGGASGNVALATGATSVTSAHTGGASGDVTLSTGGTDSTNAGGTGGASGVMTLSTGNAASTLGTSGASGAVAINTGASADSTSGDIDLTPGSGSTAANRGVVSATGLRRIAADSAAIAGARVMVRADSGGVFRVSQAAAYDIDLVTAQGGEEYEFFLTTAGANNVTITSLGGAATFIGTIVNDITSVIPATGTTLTFVSGTAAVGDNIRVRALTATLWGVTAVTSTAGGITIA